MTDSILESIRKLLIEADCKFFDSDLVMHINSILSVLNQLGVGPEDGFSILDEKPVWRDLLGDENKKLELVKTYVYLRVKMIFDPPTTSALIDSTNKIISEMEWRINAAADVAYKEKKLTEM